MNASRPDLVPDLWQRTASDVFAGLNHQLSNRLASLSVLADEGVGPSDAEHVRGDVSLLLQLLQLYRTLPIVAGETLEAVRVHDVVADAIALVGVGRETFDVACSLRADGLVPPVLSDRSRLLQFVVLLIAIAAREARSEGTARRLEVRLTGDHDSACVTVSTVAPAPSAAVASEVAALRAFVAPSDGVVQTERDAAGIVHLSLRLPSLAHQRRIEG